MTTGTGHLDHHPPDYRPDLIKVICKRCRRSIHKCVCGGRMRENAIQVRVFEEDAVRKGFDMLDAGEPMAAFDYFRDLLDGESKVRRLPRRRL